MFHTERLFSLIDLDGDGELTQSEFIGVRISRKTIPKILKIRPNIWMMLLQGCVQDKDLLADLEKISLESLHRFQGEEGYESSRLGCRMVCCWPPRQQTEKQ